MIYTTKIQDAIEFAIETHELNQKQKRKGKDIPYITHPLTVGIILAKAGAGEDVIVAGILHDTIEDSIPEKKITIEILTNRFGQDVAELVSGVTEKNRELPWTERKMRALEHIDEFSNELLLLKSADVISNTSKLIGDYKKLGNKVFDRFNASKKDTLENSLRVISKIVEKWKENPLAGDLLNNRVILEGLADK